MSKLKILSVGYDWPSDSIEYVDISSRRSLLEADIVLFRPSLRGFPADYSNPSFRGRRNLSDDASADLTRAISHWRAQLTEALDHGVLILLFLSAQEEVFYHTGDKYTGTGRARTTIRQVSGATNYNLLPFELGEMHFVNGEVIGKGKEFERLSSYWNLCAEYSAYFVYLTKAPIVPTLKVGKTSNIVGGRHRESPNLIILPDVALPTDEFIAYDEDEEEVWTEEALVFGKQLERVLVDLHAEAEGQSSVTTPPDWCDEVKFPLPGEEARLKKKSQILEKISTAEEQLRVLVLETSEIAKYRALLYEKGPRLESTARAAFELLGFETTHYNIGGDEFDALLTSDEGRFLVEVEGRDNKAIATEKFDQLSRNVDLDFSRDDVDDYAKGVLVGNAFRLSPLAERNDFFTPKVLRGAANRGFALIKSPDLFYLVQYFLATKDTKFAKKCREVIADTNGEEVKFPKPPDGMKIGKQPK